MLWLEMIKTILPTKANKRAHAQRYQFNQKIIHHLKQPTHTAHIHTTSNEVQNPIPDSTNKHQPDYSAIILEVERREAQKSPSQKKRESLYRSLCDRIYRHATRNWPVD